MTMSATEVQTQSRSASYGGLIDAIGGIATIVLAIVGLAGVRSDLLLAIATIVFGAALLIQSGALLSEYAQIIFPPGAVGMSSEEFSGGNLSAVFLVGAAGIVLGVLALIGINPPILTSVAVIAFGATLVIASNAVWHLHVLKRAAIRMTGGADMRVGNEILATEMASSSAGVQVLAGLAAMVLGILAVAGASTMALSLVALLVLGAAIVLTGSALSGAVLSFMRPTV